MSMKDNAPNRKQELTTSPLKCNIICFYLLGMPETTCSIPLLTGSSLRTQGSPWLLCQSCWDSKPQTAGNCSNRQESPWEAETNIWLCIHGSPMISSFKSQLTFFSHIHGQDRKPSQSPQTCKFLCCTPLNRVTFFIMNITLQWKLESSGKYFSLRSQQARKARKEQWAPPRLQEVSGCLQYIYLFYNTTKTQEEQNALKKYLQVTLTDKRPANFWELTLQVLLPTSQ